MTESEFHIKIDKCAGQNASRLCVGLDPDPARLPGNVAQTPAGVFEFLRRIVDATADLVCCYKPGSVFFQQFGSEGYSLLEKLIDHIPAEVPIILDARYGEFGPGAKAAASTAFQALGVDAVTLNPLLGRDSIEPFLNHRGKGVFLICLTPNAGAAELQIQNDLYVRLAEAAYEFRARNENVGLMAGAALPEHLRRCRERFPRGMILIPGLTGQSGSLASVAEAMGPSVATELIVNTTRSILYADTSSEYPKTARKAALRLREAINEAIQGAGRGGAST